MTEASAGQRGRGCCGRSSKKNTSRGALQRAFRGRTPRVARRRAARARGGDGSAPDSATPRKLGLMVQVKCTRPRVRDRRFTTEGAAPASARALGIHDAKGKLRIRATSAPASRHLCVRSSEARRAAPTSRRRGQERASEGPLGQPKLVAAVALTEWNRRRIRHRSSRAAQARARNRSRARRRCTR